MREFVANGKRSATKLAKNVVKLMSHSPQALAWGQCWLRELEPFQRFSSAVASVRSRSGNRLKRLRIAGVGEPQTEAWGE